jgi:hypothetical protein
MTHAVPGAAGIDAVPGPEGENADRNVRADRGDIVPCPLSSSALGAPAIALLGTAGCRAACRRGPYRASQERRF